MEAYIHIVHVRTRVNSENQRPIMETLKKIRFSMYIIRNY